ncbi:hypothetical protein PIROE2DRAFT_3253 [Piromyces sp. E2]|nr:hypothetical protein PIROE2DRAFT_3253 [Piromyces sp. E2]|eukprot:OUM68882.1 hypothetical protein PIROE2DRAFT_3253 [Piromyces sp. E2]
MAYKCSFDANKKASGCEPVSGYAVDGNFLVSCSNLEGDDCTVVSKGSDGDCQAGEGIFNAGGGSLCFGTRKVALPESGTKYVAFKATADHDVFNKAAGAIVMLELGKDYAVVMNKYPDSSKTLYFVNEANPQINSNSLSEPLIKIVIASNVVNGTSEVVFKGGAMPGASTYYLDGTSTKNVITCTYEDACVSTDYVSGLPESAGTTKYFITGGTLPECTQAAASATDPCIDNAAIGSVCFKGKALFKTTSSKSCAALGGAAGTYNCDENNMILTGDVNPRVTTARPTVLPVCKNTGASNVCSGVVDAAIDGTFCISGKKLYQNTVTGNTGRCAAIAGDAAFVSSIEYFAFDAQGKRVDVAGIVAGDVANNVVATYKCSVGAASTYTISDCELNGNQLPTCTVTAAAASDCYDGIAVGSYCIATNGKLFYADTAGNCAAATTDVKTEVYFNDKFMLLSGTPVMAEVKYVYVCDTSGVDCAPAIHNTVREVDVSGNVAKVCLAASDTTVVSVTESVIGYHGITVATADDFPGAESGKLTIDTKVTGKNSIVKVPYKEAELGECTNTGGTGTPPATTGVKCKIDPGSSDVEVAACRKTGANKEIHYTSGSDCKALTGTGQTTAMYYFKKDYEKIASVTTSSQVSFAYSCTFGGTKDAADQALTSCAAVYGYTVSGDVTIACSGVVGSECVVHSLLSSCTATSGDATLGKSGDRYFLCFGRNKYDLPTGTDTDVVAFASDAYHQGLGSYGVTFLKLNKDTVKVDASSFTAGYRVNPSATGLKKALIHCETANTLSSCMLVDAVNGYYKSALGNEYVIRCDGSACKSEKVDHTTCGYDTLLPTCTNTDTSKQCIDGAANDSCCIRDGVIYKNAANSCAVLTVTGTDTTQKLYFTTANVKTETAGASYYQCDVDSSSKAVSGCSVARGTLPTCARGIQATSKCVDNAGEGNVCITSSNALLVTKGTGCEALKGFRNTVHYFSSGNTEITLTAGNINTVRYVYKCTSGSSGAEASALSGCSPLTQLPPYKEITVNANAFPGVREETLMVKVTGTGELKNAVIDVKDEAALPACASNKNSLCMIDKTTTVVDHCITGDVVYENVDGKCVKLNASLPTCDHAPIANGAFQSTSSKVAFCRLGEVVYRTNGNKCVALVANDELEQISYYDRDYASVDPEISDNVYYAYQCRFNAAGVANACTFTKGVTTTATKSVYCNGWKNDICTIVTCSGASSCSSGGEGGITTNAVGICIGNNTVEFPKDGYRYAAFTTSKLNTIYDVGKGEVVLLKLTPTAALLTEYTGVEPIYLLDQANTKNNDEKKPLIQCTADDGCVSVASGTQDKVMGATGNDVTKAGIVHAYYVDGAFPNGEQIITCEQSVRNDKGEVTTQKTCSSAAPGVSYYVNGVSGGLITCDTEANSTGFGLLPTCENEEQSVSPCITNAVVDSLCVKKGKLYKIATATSCVAVNTCKIDGASTFGLYYTSGFVANEKIILCDKKDSEDGEITCQYKDDVTTCVKDEKPDHEGEILYEDNSFKICNKKEKRDLNSPIEGYKLMDLIRAKEIFKGATADMLIENKGTAMVEASVKNGYYYNVEDPAGTVIQCTENDGCAFVAVKDKYCVGATHPGNKLPVCSQITDATKKCITDAADDSHCIKDGKIYRSSSGDTKCTEITAIETCSVETISENAACTEGSDKICIKSGKYYISDYNYCIAASSITTTYEQIKSDKKCVADAEVNALCRSGNDIYKSNDNDCEFVATTLDPVSTITLSFKEDGTKATTVDDIATVYKCTQRASVLSNCIRSEREPGEIVYTASNTSEVCVNTKGESQSITTPLFDPYLSIYTEKFDAFPGNTLPGTHVLYFSKYRSVLMRERSTLPPCDIISNGNQCHINSNQIKNFMTNGNQCHSNGYPVKYCLMNNNAIYQSTSNSCDMMSGTAGSTAFYFFANANKQIEEVDIYSHVEFVYKCRFGVGEVKRCGVMKGYVITNNHIVNCNGWADCTVTPLNSLSDTCADTREGQLMGNGAAVCITESKFIALPTNNKTKYVMFQAGPTSPFYGQHQGKPILLALTARSVTVVDGGEEVKRGYYQNVKVSGDIANALVFCAKDGDMDSCHVVNGLNGYYLSQDSDRDTLPVIRCERYLGCRKQSVDAACSGNGSLSKSGSTITVCGATTTLSTSATSATYKSLSGVVAAFPGVIEENVAVVKVGQDGSVILLEDGIHLNENINGVIDKAVYKCSTSTNGITSTCTAVRASYGYYRNSGSVGYRDQFLACSINGCQAILVDDNAKCDVNSVGQLDEPDGIEINNDINKGAYMVAYNLSNIFGLEENNYAYVDVNSESVLLKNDFKSYVYTDNQKEDTNNLYPDADKINKKYEFKYVDYGIYELNCEDDDERELCK